MRYPCTARDDCSCRSNMDKKDNHEQSASTNRSATKRQSRPSSGEPELLRLQGIGPRAFQSKLRDCFPAGETFNSCQRVPECGSILAGFEHSVRTTKFLRANRIYTSTHRHPRTDPNSALATSDPICQRTGHVEQTEGHSSHPGFLLGRRRHTQLTRWTAKASSYRIDRSDPVHNFLIRLRFRGCLCVLTFLLGDGRQSERHSTGDQAGTISPSSQRSDQSRNLATIWLKAMRVI